MFINTDDMKKKLTLRWRIISASVGLADPTNVDTEEDLLIYY